MAEEVKSNTGATGAKATGAKAPGSGNTANNRDQRRGGGGRHNGRGPSRDNRRGRGDSKKDDNREDKDIIEKIVFINRCAKVVKGGRRFSFSALMVSGDGKGKVGIGFGKANEVSEAIRKASDDAKKNFEPVPLKHTTIPHEVVGEFGGARVLLRPASKGTGLISGGGVRAVVEAVGIQDLLSKSLGSSNPTNVVKATLEALRKLKTKEEIYRARGKSLETAGA